MKGSEGHFECFVRSRRKRINDEIWRHFDDHREIKEYALTEAPSLAEYTIVVVLMRDVTKS